VFAGASVTGLVSSGERLLSFGLDDHMRASQLPAEVFGDEASTLFKSLMNVKDPIEIPNEC
jgi:hypothetical protein